MGLRQEDRDKWQEISNTLQDVLRAAAAEAKERDLISLEREHTYHMSGTRERERILGQGGLGGVGTEAGGLGQVAGDL